MLLITISVVSFFRLVADYFACHLMRNELVHKCIITRFRLYPIIKCEQTIVAVSNSAVFDIDAEAASAPIVALVAATDVDTASIAASVFVIWVDIILHITAIYSHNLFYEVENIQIHVA